MHRCTMEGTLSIEKAELIAGVANEIGSGIEDMLDGARRNAHAAEGAVDALSKAMKAVEGIMAHVNKAVETDELDAEQAALVMRWVRRCHGAVDNLATGAMAAVQIHKGVMMGIERAMQVPLKVRDANTTKAERLRVAEAEGVEVDPERPHLRPVGTRPADPLAARRAEAAEARAEAAAQEDAPTTPEAPAAPARTTGRKVRKLAPGGVKGE